MTRFSFFLLWLMKSSQISLSMPSLMVTRTRSCVRLFPVSSDLVAAGWELDIVSFLNLICFLSYRLQ